jgi:putative redox protein
LSANDSAPRAELYRAPGPVDGSAYESVARLGMPDALAGMAFTGTTPSSHTINIDTGIEVGGSASAPEPNELLLLALGSCTGMDVIAILRKKRQVVTAYTINVYANQAKEHPRVYTEILVEHIVEGRGVDPKAVARSLELSLTKYCPVHALLARATRVEHAYRILDAAPGAPDPGSVD